MIYFSTKYRSTQVEIMDDLDFQGTEMKNLLSDLDRVNKWLGGNTVTIKGIIHLIKTNPHLKKVTILDLGCGDGQMLRQCARYAEKHGYEFELVGLDANGFILEEAKVRSKGFDTVSYIQGDVFSEEIDFSRYDIVLGTLFFHHFNEKDILLLLDKILATVKVGVVINDLHRSWLAFGLFKIVSHIFLKTETARFDGLVSIARGFRRKELEQLQARVRVQNIQAFISWKWAFRYQWILKKIK